jgi:sRNA-binding regulator protein Hfq
MELVGKTVLINGKIKGKVKEATKSYLVIESEGKTMIIYARALTRIEVLE